MLINPACLRAANVVGPPDSLGEHSAAHTLPDLPYDYNALEPTISAEIMTLHHSKHHQTYVNGLNAAEEQYGPHPPVSACPLTTIAPLVPHELRSPRNIVCSVAIETASNHLLRRPSPTLTDCALVGCLRLLRMET